MAFKNKYINYFRKLHKQKLLKYIDLLYSF